jgi:hypothetical protein
MLWHNEVGLIKYIIILNFDDDFVIQTLTDIVEIYFENVNCLDDNYGSKIYEIL